MKRFAIREEAAPVQKDLAYLRYREEDKLFSIELPADADPWELPLPLDGFARQHKGEVNSFLTRQWVRQRIVPPDRQNMAEILRAHGLDAYDDFALLMLTMGRCAQDGYYLVPLEGAGGVKIGAEGKFTVDSGGKVRYNGS